MSIFYDRVIIGAGLYGLYSALFCAKRGYNVLVLECDSAPFSRATYINQARVHMGYHYPRSISTALKSRGYFDRFVSDYSFCILDTFDQIYATSSKFSWTNGTQFKKFCTDCDIMCEPVSVEKYFKDGMCDSAFLTKEYTYDANILKEYFLSELSSRKNVKIEYSTKIDKIVIEDDNWCITTDKETVKTPFVLNATYASVNQINKLAGFEPFKIKYELCEIILCDVNDKLKNTGITVMDGPFFSIMPFGKTGLHSLTSVTFTPHMCSYDDLPTFNCQEKSGNCSAGHLHNCNLCDYKPTSSYPYMSSLAKKYVKSTYCWEYTHSLFSMKPILTASEIDDSRPTLIRKLNDSPTFISVLSGKINTVYDLDEVLE